MTKLESELLSAVEKGRLDYGNATGGHEDWFITEAVREVAKRYIEKAFLEASHEIVGGMPKVQRYALEVWLKENGVI